MIVVVLIEAVKIHVAIVEAFMKRGREDETQFCEFQPPNVNVFILHVFFLKMSSCLAKLRVWVLCFPYFMDIYDFFSF